MTPRNRSARGSPGPRTADRNPFPPATNAPLGPRLGAVVASEPTRRAAAPRRDFGQDDPNVLGCHALSCLQRQAFTSIFIYETQPLEATAVAGTIEDKVSCSYVVLPTRRPEMTGVPILPMRSAGLGDGLRCQLQPRLTPDATNRLLVDRPALAIQEGPDPPVAVPGCARPVPRSVEPTPPVHRAGRARGGGWSGPGPTPETRSCDTWNCSRSSLTIKSASGDGHGFLFFQGLLEHAAVDTPARRPRA